MGGMGTKCSDIFTLPVCAEHHRDFHDLGDIEMLDAQWKHICLTIGKAIDEGVLK